MCLDMSTIEKRVDLSIFSFDTDVSVSYFESYAGEGVMTLSKKKKLQFTGTRAASHSSVRASSM